MKGLDLIIEIPYKLITICKRINYYRKNGLVAKYPAEINQKIKLPLSFGIISKKFPFVIRSQKEVLLRELANLILSLDKLLEVILESKQFLNFVKEIFFLQIPYKFLYFFLKCMNN